VGLELVLAKVLIVPAVDVHLGVMNRVQTDRGLLVMMVLLVLAPNLVHLILVLFLVVIMVNVFVLIAVMEKMVIGMSIGVVKHRLR
jgi:hypothetical protein